MGARILIVEDEARLARFLELELVHEGYAVDKAADGRAGLDMALTGEYALVLLDVMLPGLNGLEVLRRLRAGGRAHHPAHRPGLGHGQGQRPGHGGQRLYHQALLH